MSEKLEAKKRAILSQLANEQLKNGALREQLKASDSHLQQMTGAITVINEMICEGKAMAPKAPVGPGTGVPAPKAPSKNRAKKRNGK